MESKLEGLVVQTHTFAGSVLDILEEESKSSRRKLGKAKKRKIVA